MKYSYIDEMDVYNGPGVRVSLFVQGCQPHLNTSDNVSLNDFNNGKEFDKVAENEVLRLCGEKNISGLTIAGADPFDWVPHMLNYHKYYYQKFYGIYNDYENMPLCIVKRYYSTLSDDDLFVINPLFHLVKKFTNMYPYKNIWVYTKYHLDTLRIDTSEDKDVAIGSDICLSCIDVIVNGKYVKDGTEFDKRLLEADNNTYIDVFGSIHENKIITYDKYGRGV